MGHAFECSDCGNPREMMGPCQYCASTTLPNVLIDSIELNIKQRLPTVEQALDQLTEYLRRSQELNIKAIILIHGYGSSGEGGRIKRALHEALEANRYADRVAEYFYGENVPYGSPAYHDLMKKRPGLKRYMRHFKSSNAGVTVLLLGLGYRCA